MRESEKKSDGVQIQRVRVEVQYDCLIPYDLQVETDIRSALDKSEKTKLRSFKLVPFPRGKDFSMDPGCVDRLQLASWVAKQKTF